MYGTGLLLAPPPEPEPEPLPGGSRKPEKPRLATAGPTVLWSAETHGKALV
eukprot:SAG22_NODE_9423_length_590_cov_1.044807_2_plen_51_part_00